MPPAGAALSTEVEGMEIDFCSCVFVLALKHFVKKAETIMTDHCISRKH